MSAELKGWEKTRPLRFAFLVDASEASHEILDEVFADCYGRWGGRYSLIVPCVDNQICPEYWPWLEHFDPDVVYSYVSLPPSAVREVHERLYPGYYIEHDDDTDRFDTRYPFDAVSSLSTLFSVARRGRWHSGGRVRIVDAWHGAKPSRVFSDNFGTHGGTIGASHLAFDASQVAGLLTIIDPAVQSDPRRGVPRDLDAVPNELAAFQCLVDGSATTMAQLSAILAPQLDVGSFTWGQSFNIVLGDTVPDRLLFWNCRLYIPSWLNTDIVCLRVTLDQLRDPDYLKVFREFMRIRNHVNDGSGGQPNLTLRSISASDADLAEAKDLIDGPGPWKRTFVQKVWALRDLVPEPRDLEHSLDGKLMNQLDTRPGWSGFPLTNRAAKPPQHPPAHFSDAPARHGYLKGFWAADYAFSDSGEGRNPQNRWHLPRRWRMAQAFGVRRSGDNRSIPPRMRAALNGCLSLPTALNAVTEVISVPQFRAALAEAFTRDEFQSKASTDERTTPMPPAVMCYESSEQPYLTGVLGMAGTANTAAELLLQPFLRAQFERLGLTTKPRAREMDNVMALVRKRLARAGGNFDPNSASDQEWLADTILRQARALRAPASYLKYSELKAAWVRHLADGDDLEDYEARLDAHYSEVNFHQENSLEKALIAMRRRKMLFQGHSWLCDYCSHENWADIGDYGAELTCEVCQTKTQAPLEPDTLFRPNDFLIRSLRDHSVLSLIWVIDQFAKRADNGFHYVGPTAFKTKFGTETSDFEVDLLMIVDDKTYIAEVKTSWRSLRQSDVAKLVEQAERLKPDIALLAIMEEGAKQQDAIFAATERLRTQNIELKVFTPSEQYEFPDEKWLFGDD